MKHLKYLLIILFLLPIIAFAEEPITIDSIEKTTLEGFTKEISSPKIIDKNIKLNIKFFEIGDSITYKIVLKNNSSDDYLIDSNNLIEVDSTYIEYTVNIVGNSNDFKANTKKEILLKVLYKNEIDAALLDTDNRFDASSLINFSMKAIIKDTDNTNEGDTIIEDSPKNTDNPEKEEPIIEKLKNPTTSDIKISIIVLICLLSLIHIIIFVKNRKKIITSIIITISILIIPTIYAIAEWSFNVEVNIVIDKATYLFNTLVDKHKTGSTCFNKYEGEVTDEVGKTVTASNVYYDTCDQERTVIFGGYCWQIVRTTETGGTKLLYYGIPENGKCEKTRSKVNGLNIGGLVEREINSSYLYGSSFTYDKTSRKYTLTDTETSTWSDSTYEGLIDKYTCMTQYATCGNLYKIISYASNTKAKVISIATAYSISYTAIATSGFNNESNSLANVGYMNNKIYQVSNFTLGNKNLRIGSNFIYDESTNTYTLSGTVKDLNNWSTDYTEFSNAHYTCFNTTGKCNSISFVYYIYAGIAYYITLDNGKNIDTAVNEMLFNNDVNKNASNTKIALDIWYKYNLDEYSEKLEDAVYCNSRTIQDVAGWSENGDITKTLQFKNNNGSNDLSCENSTDQFAVSNNKAKLTYPVGLITSEELKPFTKSIRKTNSLWSTMSPYYFSNFVPYVYGITAEGNFTYLNTSSGVGVRPAISLNNDAQIKGGIGSEENPWLVE